MKYFGFLIGALIFTVGLSGCASNQAKVGGSARTQKKQKTFAESQRDELAELSRPPIRTTVAIRPRETRMEKDHSFIETSYDAFGNKTENRVFYNNSLLKMVMLQTSASGQQQAFVYGHHGEVKSAPTETLNEILSAVPDEIAKRVEIYERPQPTELLAAAQPLEISPILNFSSNNFNAPIVETVPPVEQNAQIAEKAEIPAETAPPIKNDSKSVAAEDSALKLRAVVQSLEADRRTSIVRKTNK